MKCYAGHTVQYISMNKVITVITVVHRGSGKGSHSLPSHLYVLAKRAKMVILMGVEQLQPPV